MKLNQHVTIRARGVTRTGRIISAADWRSYRAKNPNWYIEIKGDTPDQTCYWRQDEDGGDVLDAETGEVLIRLNPNDQI